MDDKKQYQVLNPIGFGGRRERGEVIFLTDEQAARFGNDVKLVENPEEIQEITKNEAGAGEYIPEEEEKKDDGQNQPEKAPESEGEQKANNEPENKEAGENAQTEPEKTQPENLTQTDSEKTEEIKTEGPAENGQETPNETQNTETNAQ